MKSLVLVPVGLITVLALADCGSSGDNGGNVDASIPADTGSGGEDSGGGVDATTQAGDTGAGSETGTGTGDDTGTGTDASVVCGDGVVEGSEECDDGSKNGTAGDPCTSACLWVCIQGSATRGNSVCAGGNLCAGTPTCQANHTCQAGTPASDGTVCGAGAGDGGILDAGGDAGAVQVCKSGTCITDYCGDGLVVPGDGKDCDFGSGNGAGTGCEITCKFSCTLTPADSCPQSTDVCGGTNVCTPVTVGGATGQHCVGTPLANDAGCDNGGHCSGGTCSGGTCGNGVIDTGEECDWGTANNVAGSGCEPDCTFSCKKTPSDTCATSFGCEANPKTCQTAPNPTSAGSSDVGQKCVSATQIASCGACNTAAGDFVCVNAQCQASHCGDACLDKRDIVNGGPEQCDDGNTVNLDGCDSNCKFEQDQRATSVAVATTTDSFCANNALAYGGTDAGALTGLAVGLVLGPDLQAAVLDGTSTIAFKFMGITDLTGQNQDAGLTLGALTGTPAAAPAGVTYDGGSDEDWWYTTGATTIDSSRNPTSLLPATFAGGTLNGAGSLNLSVSIAGTLVQLDLIGAKIQAKIGAANAPLESSGSTPGHLASEHLDPSLTSFESMTAGLLCGDITAASLASAPVPTALITGTYKCAEGYSASLTQNSLLDVVANGCNVLGAIPAVNPRQPDQFDPSAPAVGAGGPYTLVITGNHVTGCQDKTGTAVVGTANFQACLQAAAYSSYFNFTSDRVIMK